MSALLLEGCLALREPGPAAEAEKATSVEPEAVTIESGSLRSSSGCRFGYSVYRHAGDERPADVVLAHGFLRDKEHMDGLARALAESGIPTVALDLCNMKPWDGAHRRNAEDMRAVARRLAGPAPVYAGFSAGGLAALLAARADPAARGVLTLDLVDLDGLGEQAARGYKGPIIGLVGEASGCNAGNNGLPVFAAAPQAELVRVEGATHCDFESPSDGLCRLACEPGDRTPLDVARIRAEIIGLAVAAARRLLEPGAAVADSHSPP